ncbi:MAG: DUF1552 domain-containing protein [Bacteroidetes bacterium]|nr:DUF1552 domain-containing protein [Bacteroidota bacterium]MDA1121764.1 DUF1552 domain-containing protein [Bacteroidota bacterium]
MKSWHINRRRVLRGIGATVGLPFLQAMVPPGMKMEKYLENNRPKRLAVFYFPNGTRQDYWSPEQAGRNFEMSPTLKPLEAYRKKLLILNELKNNLVDVSGTDGHYTKTAPFLTCQLIEKTTGANINVKGTSMDQVLAQHIGRKTRFSSLEYGMDPVRGGVDSNVGYTRLYGAAISWESPTRPKPKEINPRFAFDRMFRNYIPGQVLKKENPWKKSVVDLVLEDASSLSRQLGAADQNKMAEYLESVRAVERRLEAKEDLSNFEANLTPDIRKELIQMNVRLNDFVDLNSEVNITGKIRLMMDINALALWSDATRVTTFMFGNSVSNRNFSFLDGVEGGHHSVSHHRGHPQRIEMYGKINQWHSEQFAYFLDRISSMKDGGDQSLFDNSTVLFGSSIRDGDKHRASNLPIVLAGNGGGILDTGQNLFYKKDTPLANLYLTLLKAMEVPIDSFADSTGELPGIRV